MHCIKDGREIVICMRLVGGMSVGMTAIIEQNMYFRIARKSEVELLAIPS